jgi:hypothetical protein
VFATCAELTVVRARQSDDQALIAHLKLQIEKLNRDRYGPRSERSARLLDQLELTLEELEAKATEDELAAEMAAAKVTSATTTVASFSRRRPPASRSPSICQAVRQAGTARCRILLLARSRWRASTGASGRLQRTIPGRCLWRLQQAL